MARGFKNGQSLHFLIEHAPLAILADFFDDVEDGLASSLGTALRISEDGLQSDECDLRAHLFDLSSTLPKDDAARLDGHAQRIVPLAEDRGPEVLRLVRRRIPKAEQQAAFDCQLDDLGRCVWLYLKDRDRFEEAEILYHANHYRGVGRLYEAYDVVEGVSTFEWTPDLKLSLETRITEMLELSGRCVVTHVSGGKAEDGNEVHYLIVRHGGPLSSVREHLENGRQGTHYYRPPNEATLVYTPATNTIEVCAATMSVRQQLARSFVEAGLGHDLSNRPLTQKNYDFSRFLASFDLPTVSVEGFDVIENKVVGAAVWPIGSKRKAALEVDLEDDIELAIDELFGEQNVFQRGFSISKIVIAVQYCIPGESSSKILNISLGHGNQCNLSSKKNPSERKLGFSLLKEWGIVHPVEPLSDADERAILPVLLAILDQGQKHVSGQFFLERGLKPDALLRAGFVINKGRFAKHRIEGEGAADEVEIFASSEPGFASYHCPITGKTVDLRRENFDKYAIKSEWLEETILKSLKPLLSETAIHRLDRRLISLGKIRFDGDLVPCFLAIGLNHLRNLRDVDILIRARRNEAAGLILSTGAKDQPLCLGANVVLPLVDCINDNDEPGTLSHELIADAYRRGRQMARGGAIVELAKNGPYSATLYVPGRPIYSFFGAKKIKIIERLVVAFQRGVAAVPTKELLEGMSSASPRQVFGEAVWKEIVDVYVGQAGQRGSWQLLA